VKNRRYFFVDINFKGGKLAHGFLLPCNPYQVNKHCTVSLDAFVLCFLHKWHKCSLLIYFFERGIYVKSAFKKCV
jgi:hypothetical protein